MCGRRGEGRSEMCKRSLRAGKVWRDVGGSAVVAVVQRGEEACGVRADKMFAW